MNRLPARVARQRGAERQAVGPHRRARAFEHDERGVSLVEVACAGLDPERVEQAPSADPERDLLAQPHLGTVAVELAGDAPVGRFVDRNVRVEQIEGHAADHRLPDAEPQLPSREVDGDLEPARPTARASAGWGARSDRCTGRAPLDGRPRRRAGGNTPPGRAARPPPSERRGRWPPPGDRPRARRARPRRAGSRRRGHIPC